MGAVEPDMIPNEFAFLQLHVMKLYCAYEINIHLIKNQ